MYRASVPAMQLWSGRAAANRTPSTTVDDWESSVYSTPTARRAVPNFTRAQTPIEDRVDPKYVLRLPHPFFLTNMLSLTTPWKPTAEDGDEGEKKSGEKLTDSAKLKGVLWPGMDLFDAATPLMKRQRNQKKDNNALESMIATSRAVEPAEISYHANGEFRGSRDIFGPLSTESSPTRSASPKRRRAPRRAAPALNDLSVNAPRLRAPPGRKGADQREPQKSGPFSSAYAGYPYLQPAPALNPLAADLTNRRFQPSTEEDEEFRLTVGNFIQQEERKKRAFTIFQEAPQISPSKLI
jgi:hypothetical protein